MPRFVEEVSDYYVRNNVMEMVEFLQCLKQCWKTHGCFGLDVSHYQRVPSGWKSGTLPLLLYLQGNRPACFLEAAGILESSSINLKLHCLQTSCES